jgi:two-component system NtrC family sensor kinase
MENNLNNKETLSARARSLVEEYYELSHRILRLGNRGLPRGEFLRKLFTLLTDFSGCDAVEFRLRNGGFCYYAENVGGAGSNFRFGIIDGVRADDGLLLPCIDADLPLERLYCCLLRGRLGRGEPYLTEDGAFWTGDVSATFVRPEGEGDAPPQALDLPGDYRSLIAVPFTVGADDLGLLALKAREVNFFGREEAEFFEGVAQNVGVAVADRRTHWALGERVKEMTCLYGIAEIASRPGVSAQEVFEGAVRLLPPAMQYPEITVGRIVIDGEVYSTEEMEDTPYRLSADVVVDGVKRGIVEVQYKEAKMDYDAVARQIGLVIENRKAEDERVRLQEQLRHADRLATIGQLAAGIAHELNEPLEIILAFSQLVNESPGASEQTTRDLEKIMAASLKARGIVKNLLIFARQMPTIESTVDLSDIAADALSFLEPRFLHENVECILEIAGNIPPLKADPGQLNQVVVNLVVNAVQAMPDGGKLTVRTRADDECAYLEVEDTGTGIPDEIKPSIFLPFFTTKEVGKGTGLGLAVVHGIVAGHGGDVAFESEAGRGSRFVVRFPFGSAGGKECRDAEV